MGTVGVSPLVSTQFNFAEVGVNVDLTPQVHSTHELTLHIEVEVSSVRSYVDLGGISQPVIGQRKNIADVRLREGEVTILGGLSTVQDSKAINGIPGLVNIPALGSVLFGSTNTDKERGELLIALIPHIVRTPDYTAENLRGIYAGNDTTVKLNYAQKPEPAAPPSPPPAAPAPETPKPTAPEATGQARISFTPPAIQASLSGTITVTIQVENAADLFSVSPLKIKFDPSQLRLNDIVPGDLLSRDGARVTSSRDIRNDAGEATLTITRLPGSPGVAGTGAIAVLNFVAVGKGSSAIAVVDAGLKNTQQQPVAVTLGELPVKVQ